MIGGTRPVPLEIKRANGNPGCRPLNENEPVHERGIPDQPLLLSEDAKAHWDRLAPILHKARVLTVADAETLGALCESLARYYRAEKHLAEEGEIIYAKAKSSRATRPYQNPWLTVSREALSRVLAIGTEFGLTPSSRCRIKVPLGTEESNPLSVYLGGARVDLESPAEEEPEIS